MGAKKRTIAVVNHDAVFLRLIERTLNLEGYEVIICPSGTAAHDIIAKAKPDLVMLDTWIETRDAGWVLLQTLALDPETRDIPILISSSDDPEELKRKLGEPGPVKVSTLHKPFSPEALIARVAEMADGH